FDRLNLLLHRGEEFEIAFLTEGLKNFDIFSTKENASLVSGILNGFPTIKKRLYGGHKEVVLFKELRQLIGEARNLIETLHLTEVTLDLYSNELKSATKVSRLPYRHHPEYERFSTTRINSFKKEFKHVFSKYHYFLDHENLQTYQSRIRRTHDGFVLNMFLRSAAKIILTRYGHEENGLAMLSLEEIDVMMKDFKPLLEPMGLWTKKIDTFARNMLLRSEEHT